MTEVAGPGDAKVLHHQVVDELADVVETSNHRQTQVPWQGLAAVGPIDRNNPVPSSQGLLQQFAPVAGVHGPAMQQHEYRRLDLLRSLAAVDIEVGEFPRAAML